MQVKDEKSVDFESGAKRSDSTGKGRFDLISPFALTRLALVYEQGGKQKGDRNWERGFSMHRCYDSALRHIVQKLMGMDDEDHAAQAAWNLFAALDFEERIKLGILPKELDDMPKPLKSANGGGEYD